MKMKLKQWASVAEIIGAVAVVVSLVYVGIQVHDSAGAVRSAAANDTNAALQAWYMEVGSDRETSSLIWRGLMSEEALPDEEEFQYLMMTHAVFLSFQNSYLLAQEGTIDQELLGSLHTTIGNINQLPGMQRYWRQRRSYLHAGFAEWVDRLSAEGSDITMDLYNPDAMAAIEAEPFTRGPYPVGSTNLEVAPEYADLGDDEIHDILVGRAEQSGRPGFVADILRHPESAWITRVRVPDDPAMYGPASGMTMPVATFIAYPAAGNAQPRRYEFPYHGSRYGVFEDMLDAGEEPAFANGDEQYPLIILSHGASAHGLFDVRHAHSLASHGYIVAVLTYGDNRTLVDGGMNAHLSYLRPLLTKAVLDSLLDSETFGPRIDADNIGITGHSFGGFTALALAGGPFLGNTNTVSDPRITAAVIAAPWVGGYFDSGELFAFGPDNVELSRVSIPVISFFGTRDEATLASFILPAMKQLSGPTYVIELVDQPHVFEQGSWEDRDNWELLFFSAYLKHDPESLAILRSARSMQGGNEDVQLFDYQQNAGSD